MSQKYKLEEFHDPDYNQQQQRQQYSRIEYRGNQQQIKTSEINEAQNVEALNEPCSSNTSTPRPPLSKEIRIKKICDVIKREFSREINAKKTEIDEITKRLTEAKELLAKIRYAVVYNYYTKKNLAYSESEYREVSGSVSGKTDAHETGKTNNLDSLGSDLEKFQPAIHPSLKKLIGKRTVDYDELLKARPTRKAAKTATQHFPKKVKPLEPVKLNFECNNEETVENSAADGVATKKQNQLKVPRYIPPKEANKRIEQINSARGRSQYRHLIAVGNTSKYVGHEESDSLSNVTHKWLVYVTTKTAVPIKEILTNVRFFLHDSYKPNDVIEVSSPPFELSRRGWGEFPIRAQLYFHPHLQQKPVQIFHNIVLDKKNTGLQTMGAETIVELWLNIPSIEMSSSDTTIAQNGVANNELQKSDPESEEDSTTQVKKIKLSDSKEHEHQNSQRFDTKLQKTEAAIQNTIVIKQEISSPTTSNDKPSTGIIPTPAEMKNSTPDKQSFLSSTNSLVCFSNMPGKKFMKCVNKDGKISFVELLSDPNNPKILKLVLPNKALMPSLGTKQTSGTLSSSLSRLPVVRPLSAPNTQNSMLMGPITQSMNKQTVTTNSMANSTLQSTVPKVTKLITTNNVISTESQKGSSSSCLRALPATPPATPTNKPFTNSVQGKAVIMKNGKIFIVDKSKAIIQPKLQQSLLKPQISLLKSAMAHSSGQVQHTTSSSSALSCNVKIKNEMTVFRKNSGKDKSCDSSIAQIIPDKKIIGLKPIVRRQHAIDLENKFYKYHNFPHTTASVLWLLRRLPLISETATQHGLRESFPFIVISEQFYYAMPWAKQRSYEWLRAKYIKVLLSKHHTVSKFTPEWTTRQIVVFARNFGFTPALYPPLSETNTASKLTTASYKDIIKDELIREHLQNDTISFNHRIRNWLNDADTKLYKIRKESVQNDKPILNSEVIIVDDEVDALNSSKDKVALLESKEENLSKDILPVKNDMQNEYLWVRDICRNLQIKYQPEEIIEGVMHRTAETVLITALRSFVEDLLRQACYNRAVNTDNSQIDIKVEDILRAITHTKHFDFMTNKHLGIEKIMS